MQISLTVLQNQSITFSPINRLPPEVLSHIFALTKHCLIKHVCNTKHYSFIDVCKYWRRVALSAPGLWSQVDIKVSQTGSQISPALKWSGDGLFDLHLHGSKYPKELDSDPSLKVATKDGVAALAPHIHRTHSLQIESQSQDYHFIDTIITLWLGHANPASVKTLSVSRPAYCELLHYTEPNRTRVANIENVLCYLTTLRLDKVAYNWGSSAFRGLVDLWLEYFEQRISITVA
ncbi:F-box-like protein [Ceratobasidium sp. AG-Ba]|nr:F-box-like protein [Ceratobasidium sp. AG-Ba]